jgi:hypothetical protein
MTFCFKKVIWILSCLKSWFLKLPPKSHDDILHYLEESYYYKKQGYDDINNWVCLKSTALRYRT